MTSRTPPPPSAIPIWHDGKTLYTALPGPNGTLVLRYSLTVTGLQSALGIVRLHAHSPHELPAKPSDLPWKSNPKQPATTLDILRSLDLLPR